MNIILKPAVLALSLMAFEMVNAQTQVKHEMFFVNGNCEQCKDRIEAAAKIKGVKKAVWDVQTRVLHLEYDSDKVTAAQVLRKIADVGHDNAMYKAEDKVYNNLVACCLYDRNDVPKEGQNLIETQAFKPSENSVKDEHEGHSHAKVEAPTEAGNEHIGHNHSSEEKSKDIEGVKITKVGSPTALNKNEVGLTFNINSKELLKAACCNLSESFETNATVDVSFSNAVTGTKQLKMLGLDQKYTSLTKELLPEIRGLASAYGMNFIPGKWIGGIQLTKGGSTVTNGYESITGQINTELLKTHEGDATELNLYADAEGRAEANITHTSQLNAHWSQSILLHGNSTFSDTDMNHDGFLDRPKGSQLNATYLLNFNDLDHSGFGSHFGINFLKDERTGGQVGFDKRTPQKDQDLYGVGIDISRFQVWNKTGYVFKGKPYQSLGWMNQFTYHQQDSFFGLRNYFGKQNTFYSNLIFESILGNTNHKYKVGASYMLDTYNEDYLTQNYKRNESVAGAFAEYTLTGLKYTLVAGARVDFHNLAGTQFTPRLNFKYDFSPKTILRLSAGRGFRTANIFAESQAYFASNRKIEILENGGKIYGLNPEIAWNYGVSLQQEFKIFNRKSSIVADFFRTDFQDQVITDLDYSAQKILFYNLEGKSYANSLQVQWDFTPIKNFDVRAAYKYYDVNTEYITSLRKAPFMAKHRGFLNLAYKTNTNNKGGFWNFDTTLNIVGKQRMPFTQNNPAQFQLANYSDAYATLNAQVSKNINKDIRIYLGGENLTNYKQKNAILDAKNPFGNYFDGGMVYGPIMGINAYLGVDFKF
ncbi:TonB-dependent receptor domain-containing protein [Elizabethkingia sp. JS20170427COW]|uniref:TonB-dependent receptor domain-containing protein n=1 Tax=Elizabethkingia sp. JS20170427COW TaxID=2583851 RepID=UPI001110DBBC|nr:TonB-dependent receptor [Elizabethkingia sp. JS20170427COW]QCX52567.1 TonB-dependent receptor [Elizabethkingia sp. JS20170427COW]